MKNMHIPVPKNWRFILFAIFAVVSVYAPLSIIHKYEAALRYGNVYKFRTKPVDPYDAFRGRYVTLSYADDQVAQSEDKSKTRYSRDGIVYVRLKVDADGFAKPVEASRTPLSGDDVITVDNAYSYGDGWRLYYPFNRYYLPEDVAPEAEKLYASAHRRNGGNNAAKNETYAAVRVRNGVGVIEELFINGKPVREAVREALRKE